MENIELIDKIFTLIQKCLGLEIPEKVKKWVLLIVAAILFLLLIGSIIYKIAKWIASIRHRPWRNRKIKDILIPDMVNKWLKKSILYHQSLQLPHRII